MLQQIGLTAGEAWMTYVIFFGTLYFVLKWAVKNGINQSMLVSEEDRRKMHEKEMKIFDKKE